MSFPEYLTLAEFKKLPVEHILLSISSEQQSVTVQLPNGNEIIIRPKSQLKPLPVLKGHIPKGWKEAIYHESE